MIELEIIVCIFKTNVLKSLLWKMKARYFCDMVFWKLAIDLPKGDLVENSLIFHLWKVLITMVDFLQDEFSDVNLNGYEVSNGEKAHFEKNAIRCKKSPKNCM